MKNLIKLETKKGNRSKLSVISILLILFLVISTIALSVSNNDLQNDYNKLLKQFTEISEENERVRSEQVSLNEEIDSLLSENEKYKNQISGLETEVQNLKDYKNQYFTLKSDYDKLKKDNDFSENLRNNTVASDTSTKLGSNSNTGTKINTNNLNDVLNSNQAINNSSADDNTTSDESVPEEPKQDETVYWVADGEVYHSTPNCRTLKRSINIQSGTIAQSGKSRPCKVCH